MPCRRILTCHARLSCRLVTVTIREDEPEDILPHEYFLRRIYKNVHPKGFKPFLTPPTADDVGEPFAAPAAAPTGHTTTTPCASTHRKNLRGPNRI